MFAKLLSRLVPLPASAHDHLFTTFAPDGAPPQVLNTIYHQYRAAFPDERVPPQHLHFRTLVDRIIGANWRRLDGIELRRVSSAYVCCFERSEAFEFQLALWRVDPEFRRLLTETRTQLVADLMPLAAAESARRAHFSRWKECRAAPLDIEAPNLLGFIQQMMPDDWHEIALHWNWNTGTSEIEWITAQRDCDRATALFVLCSGAPGEVATRRLRADEEDRSGFVRALAARIEGGFYLDADLSLALSMRRRTEFEAELATARATCTSPWQIPADLLAHDGRQHQPKYAVTDGRAHYAHEHWLTHLAPKRSR